MQAGGALTAPSRRRRMATYQEFHRRSIDEPEAFWREQAKLIDWHKPFSKVLDYSRPPFARWFVGGETNLCDDAQPKLMFTADAGMRGGKAIPYKGLVDEAIHLSQHPPHKVVIVNRGIAEFKPVAGRDLDYAQLRDKHLSAQVPVVWLEASEPSYILYTSGTTGKPKGV